MKTLKTYTAHVDSKNRIALPGAQYDSYHVKEYANGCIVLEPMKPVRSRTISAESLMMMEESIRNFKCGNVSHPVDLAGFD